MVAKRRPGDGGSDEFEDELASLTLDESFVAAARVKEPAAAERRPAHPVAAPPRPRPTRAPRHRSGPPVLVSLRRRVPGAVAIAIIAVMLVTVTAGGGLFGPGGTRDSGAKRDQVPATTAAPNPFASLPAAGYATGESGLVLPAATAKGDFSTAEVALALSSVRTALAATSLDVRVVLHGDLTPVREALGPVTLAEIDALLAGTSTTGRAPLDILTRFAPGTVRIASGIRVSGSIQAELDQSKPASLLITTRHVFAYAVEVAADADGSADEVVVLRRDAIWRVTKLADTSLGRPEIQSATAAATGRCTDDQAFVRPAVDGARVAPPVHAVAVVWNVSESLDPSTSCFLALPGPAAGARA